MDSAHILFKKKRSTFLLLAKGNAISLKIVASAVHQQSCLVGLKPPTQFYTYVKVQMDSAHNFISFYKELSYRFI
jgi:hypothetical protein